jgi:hypothetical protein
MSKQKMQGQSSSTASFSSDLTASGSPMSFESEFLEKSSAETSSFSYSLEEDGTTSSSAQSPSNDLLSLMEAEEELTSIWGNSYKQCPVKKVISTPSRNFYDAQVK